MFYKVEISAESVAAARVLVDALLAERLVTGGQFIETPSRFLWKGEVIDQQYVTSTSFTTDEYRDAIVHVVERISDEEVPMVCFIPFEANQKLADWIVNTLAGAR